MVQLVQAILSCVYSRHHDGYVREKYLRRLLTLTHPWVAPFVFQLVGEYVDEIIQLIADNSALLLAHDHYRAFIRDNPDLVTVTWAQAITYANLYSAPRALARDYRRWDAHKADVPALRFLSECCRVTQSCQGTRTTCRT